MFLLVDLIRWKLERSLLSYLPFYPSYFVNVTVPRRRRRFRLYYKKTTLVYQGKYHSSLVVLEKDYLKVPPKLKTTMTNPMEVNLICGETGAYREEALYYLEAYDWNLAPAMEACGVKTLPSVKVKSSPVVSVTEQSTAEEYSATPLTIIPPRVSNQDPRSINYPSLTSNPLPPRKRSHSGRVLNPPQELSHELKQERINLFLAVASDLPSQEVLSYLERFNWDVERAGAQYYEDRDQQRTSYDRTEIDQSYLQPVYTPMIGVSNLEGFSQNETSTALPMDLMQHSAPPLPSLHLPSESQFHDSVGYQLGDHSSSFSG